MIRELDGVYALGLYDRSDPLPRFPGFRGRLFSAFVSLFLHLALRPFRLLLSGRLGPGSALAAAWHSWRVGADGHCIVNGFSS
jgi:hypothetical protein